MDCPRGRRSTSGLTRSSSADAATIADLAFCRRAPPGGSACSGEGGGTAAAARRSLAFTSLRDEAPLRQQVDERAIMIDSAVSGVWQGGVGVSPRDPMLSKSQNTLSLRRLAAGLHCDVDQIESRGRTGCPAEQTRSLVPTSHAANSVRRDGDAAGVTVPKMASGRRRCLQPREDEVNAMHAKRELSRSCIQHQKSRRQCSKPPLSLKYKEQERPEEMAQARKCAVLVARPDPRDPVIVRQGWTCHRPKAAVGVNIPAPPLKSKSPRAPERVVTDASVSSIYPEATPTLSSADMSPPASPAMRSDGTSPTMMRSGWKARSLDTSGMSTSASVDSFRTGTGAPSSPSSLHRGLLGRPAAYRSQFAPSGAAIQSATSRQRPRKEEHSAQRRAAWVL